MLRNCQKSEIRNQRSEIRDQISDIGNPRSEIRDQKSEIRDRKSEIRSPVVLSFLVLLLLTSSSCSSAKKEEKSVIEYYPVAYRQLAPQPVYSRVTWSNLPGPIPPKVRDNAPLLLPTISFELHRTNLDEAIQALAQTMGYTWSYPAEVAKKKISINMVAPVDEILREIESQAKVNAVLDHESRTLRIVSGNTAAQLPRAQLSK